MLSNPKHPFLDTLDKANRHLERFYHGQQNENPAYVHLNPAEIAAIQGILDENSDDDVDIVEQVDGMPRPKRPQDDHN